jgi:hypothetical protein
MMFFTVHICNQGLIDVIYAKWYVTRDLEEPVKHEKLVHPNKIMNANYATSFLIMKRSFKNT